MKEIFSTALEALKIDRLNEMQEMSLKANESGRNVLLLSPTGSGKTLAFLLPLLKQIKREITEVQALILAPSRELALQIDYYIMLILYYLYSVKLKGEKK